VFQFEPGGNLDEGSPQVTVGDRPTRQHSEKS